MEGSNIALNESPENYGDELFEKIDSQFPDTSLEHIVNNPNFKIESPLKYKGNSTIVLKTKSVIKEDDITRIEQEFRIKLDDNSSFFYDEVSQRYIRKPVNNNESDEIKGMKPERFHTCNEVNSKSAFKSPEKKITFSTIKTEFEFSENETYSSFKD